jgi:integrase
MTNSLIKRGHSWSVRYIVPTSIRAKVGKKEVVRALGTRDLDQARKLKHAALAKIIKEVEAIVRPGNAIVREGQAAALEVVTAQGDGGLIEVVDEAGIIHVIMESKANLLRDVVEGRAEEIERVHGVAIAQQYADIALRGSMPVKDAGDQWLDSQEGKVTRGTIDGRRKVISVFTEDMGNLPISKVSPRVATSWLSGHLEPSGRSPKTLAKYIAAMNLLWGWSRRREWCEGVSPFDGLTSELKKIKSNKRAYTDDELKTFMDALEARSNKRPEEYDVGILLLESSARLNEIAELRVKDIYDDGEVRIVDGKTGAADRILFFYSDRAKEILTKRITGKGADEQVFHELSPGGQDEKLGHSLSKRMRGTLAEVIPNAMKEGLDLHSIRRWGATVWESIEGLEDINRTLIKRAFGHKVGDLLGDIYSEGPDRDRLKKTFKVFSGSVQKRVP